MNCRTRSPAHYPTRRRKRSETQSTPPPRL